MDIHDPDYWLHEFIGGGKPTKKGWVRPSRRKTNKEYEGGEHIRGRNSYSSSRLSNWIQGPSTKPVNQKKVLSMSSRVRSIFRSPSRLSNPRIQQATRPNSSPLQEVSRASLQRAISFPDRKRPAPTPLQASHLSLPMSIPPVPQRDGERSRRASSPGPQRRSMYQPGISRSQDQNRPLQSLGPKKNQTHPVSSSSQLSVFSQGRPRQRQSQEPRFRGSQSSQEALGQSQWPTQRVGLRSWRESQKNEDESQKERKGTSNNEYEDEQGLLSEEMHNNARSTFSIEEEPSRHSQKELAHGARSYYEGLVTWTRANKDYNNPSSGKR